MRRREAWAGGAAAAVLLGLAGAYAAGYRVNTTASMPAGLWHVEDLSAVDRGMTVTVCLPESTLRALGVARGYLPAGYCPGGLEPLVKPVAAVGGDVVEMRWSGVSVNGVDVPGTAPLSIDSAGRALQGMTVGRYDVAPGEVWLLSGHDPRSFDSRYWGPVSVSSLVSAARPVWVR